jgi:hypothetical protein
MVFCNCTLNELEMGKKKKKTESLFGCLQSSLSSRAYLSKEV